MGSNAVLTQEQTVVQNLREQCGLQQREEESAPLRTPTIDRTDEETNTIPVPTLAVPDETKTPYNEILPPLSLDSRCEYCGALL
ncbi:hypothetical protein AC1031_011599 [Aphanomyces cochlioides]|nr:hypothetical protein AC1031_011599 [Aphanomyces cochlioides]